MLRCDKPRVTGLGQLAFKFPFYDWLYYDLYLCLDSHDLLEDLQEAFFCIRTPYDLSLLGWLVSPTDYHMIKTNCTGEATSRT